MGNAWVTQLGPQYCCHDPRFSVSGVVVTDAKTGRLWYRYSGFVVNFAPQDTAPIACAGVIAGGRLPTMAEYEEIMIGRPIGNYLVCDPVFDNVSFHVTATVDMLAKDGCINPVLGISKEFCSQELRGFMCISD